MLNKLIIITLLSIFSSVVFADGEAINSYSTGYYPDVEASKNAAYDEFLTASSCNNGCDEPIEVAVDNITGIPNDNPVRYTYEVHDSILGLNLGGFDVTKHNCVLNYHWSYVNKVCEPGEPEEEQCPTPRYFIALSDTQDAFNFCNGGCEYHSDGAPPVNIGSSSENPTFTHTMSAVGQVCNVDGGGGEDPLPEPEPEGEPLEPLPPPDNCPSGWVEDDEGACEPDSPTPEPDDDDEDFDPQCPTGYLLSYGQCFPIADDPFEDSEPPYYSSGGGGGGGGGSDNGEGTSDDSNGENNGSTGNGSGTGTGEDNEGCDPNSENCGEGTVSGGQSCAIAPTCSGDPLMCHQIYQQWETRCADYVEQKPFHKPDDDDFESEFGTDIPKTMQGIKDGLDDNSETIDLGAIQEQNTSGSCPVATSVNVLGYSFTIQYTFFCQLADLISNLVMLAAWMVSIRIIYSGIVG